MSTVRDIDDIQCRAEAAIDWLLCLTENPRDDAILDQWLSWCGEDEENLAEFRRACDLWNAFDSDEMNALLAAARTAEPPARQRPISDELPRRPARAARRRRPARRFGAIAATLLLGVAAAFFARQQIENLDREVHTTPVAQHDTEVLADGSRLEVGAASRVASHYDEGRREVEVEEGEAFFEVAPDPGRPFVVRAGEVRVRAVGTAFNVRRGATRTVVTVTEGAVEVLFRHWYDLLTPAEERRTLAAAGQQVIYDRTTGSLHTERGNTEAATAWRRDSRSFNFLNEPLADVVAYVNRYSERKIVIADETLARRTFTGSVHHNRGDDWLRALERAYPLRVQPAEDGTVQLVPTTPNLAASPPP